MNFYLFLTLGMVRLKLINLNPDFSTPTAPLTEKPMPSWPSVVLSSLEDIPFEMRYLVEALVSHGTVMLPEVGDLMRSLGRYRFTLDEKIRILEGLFTWTRRNDIDSDVRRKSPAFGLLNEPNINNRCRSSYSIV